MPGLSTLRYLMGLLVVMTVAIQATVRGQSPRCETLDVPSGHNLAYRLRGNRCEGMYTASTAGGLQLVSLLQGPLQFDWRPNVVLDVTSPLVRRVSVNVQAMAIPLTTYYRMDSTLGPGGVLSWPVGDVIFPANLRPGTVGVFGWIGTDRGRVFVPLRVRQRGSAGGEAGEPLILTVRPSVDVERVTWRSSRLQGGECSAFSAPRNAASERVFAGSPVGIQLPADVTGDLCVEIAVIEAGAAPAEGGAKAYGAPLRVRLRVSEPYA